MSRRKVTLEDVLLEYCLTGTEVEKAKERLTVEEQEQLNQLKRQCHEQAQEKQKEEARFGSPG